MLQDMGLTKDDVMQLTASFEENMMALRNRCGKCTAPSRLPVGVMVVPSLCWQTIAFHTAKLKVQRRFLPAGHSRRESSRGS